MFLKHSANLRGLGLKFNINNNIYFMYLIIIRPEELIYNKTGGLTKNDMKVKLLFYIGYCLFKYFSVRIFYTGMFA